MARHGAIASAHPLISATGARVLADGGNAADAAIAAALVGSVVLPAMCGIGGDLFAVVHRPGPEGGDLRSFQGSGVGPCGVDIDWLRERGEISPSGRPVLAQQGPLSPAVPGFVDGAFALLERYGSRSFAELAEPAIGYAADGFPLSVMGAAAIHGRQALLSRYPTSTAVFLPGGRVPKPGELLRQTDLARTIAEIATGGSDAFYRGDLARRMGDWLQHNGGALRAEDFAGHVTDVTPPLASTYRGYTIYQTQLPTQGFVTLETLNILENADLGAAGLSDATGVHLGAEALKAAFADRNAYAGDPRAVDAPLETLVSKPWAAERFRAIDPVAASVMTAGALQPAHTTYLCAVDGDGLMVSLIFSVSDWFGSGVVVGDTGVLLNNRAGHCFSLEEGHPNQFAPGKRPMHTLNCYLVADSQATPVLVGGTPGGDFQPQWNVQTLTGLIDRGLDVQAAIEQPRWQIWPATYPADVGSPPELRVEDRLGEAAIADLEARGHNVIRLGPWGAGGAVQVIARDPETGVLAAGSDPRSEGLAIGV
ncbi:MAG: gamma-glutamyltransferase [Thermomicrobiales bacterium]|nr:gamma-glutamyltransferase [Thermomicrobiales bacterium]